MDDMMKAMGSGKRGPMAGIAQAMGFGGGGMGRSARLYRAIVATEIAVGAGSYFSLSKDPYLLALSATAHPGPDHDGVLRTIHDTLPHEVRKLHGGVLPPGAPTEAGRTAAAAGNVFGPTDAGGSGNGTVFEVAGSGFLVACYVLGTKIATPAGERAIESLRAGELVLTTSGEARPVAWMLAPNRACGDGSAVSGRSNHGVRSRPVTRPIPSSPRGA